MQGLTNCVGLFRDPLLPHEAAQIALELLRDIKVKLPHTDDYTARACIQRLFFYAAAAIRIGIPWAASTASTSVFIKRDAS